MSGLGREGVDKLLWSVAHLPIFTRLPSMLSFTRLPPTHHLCASFPSDADLRVDAEWARWAVLLDWCSLQFVRNNQRDHLDILETFASPQLRRTLASLTFDTKCLTPANGRTLKAPVLRGQVSPELTSLLSFFGLQTKRGS